MKKVLYLVLKYKGPKVYEFMLPSDGGKKCVMNIELSSGIRSNFILAVEHK